jgi:hypothetical protein
MGYGLFSVCQFIISGVAFILTSVAPVGCYHRIAVEFGTCLVWDEAVACDVVASAPSGTEGRSGANRYDADWRGTGQINWNRNRGLVVVEVIRKQVVEVRAVRVHALAPLMACLVELRTFEGHSRAFC